MKRTIRVLLCKGGVDGHTLGFMVVAHALRDAGMEVVIGQLHMTPDDIVETASQEGVHVIGISQLDGNHMTPLKSIVRLIREKGLDDILFIAGGVIPPEDIKELKNCGVKAVFLPGIPTSDIVNFINENVTIS